MKSETELTDNAYWDNYWSGYSLPAIVGNNPLDQVLNAQFRTFDLVLSADSEKSILEIGGAPGQYLAYFAKKYGFKASALDYSAIGCDVTRKNFELLGLEVTLYQQDLLSMDGTIPLFDIVYSLGVVEHFTDLELVIGKHLELLKPGGILIIGVPYFIKVFYPLFQWLLPKTMSGHYIESIDIRKWKTFERKFNLQILFKNYIGGFEPLLIRAVINKEHSNDDTHHITARKYVVSLLNIYGRIRKFIYRHFPACHVIERINSRFFSAYAIGMYRKTDGL